MRWRCTAASSSAASNERLVNVTTVAPSVWGTSAPRVRPVPCMSGAHGAVTTRSPSAIVGTSAGMASSGVSGSRPSWLSAPTANDDVHDPRRNMTPFGMPVVPPV